jgi:hypothetical protein
MKETKNAFRFQFRFRSFPVSALYAGNGKRSWKKGGFPMLDPAKLGKAHRQDGRKTVCACPACRENGGDKSGEHLAVFESGAFHCIADNSPAHRKRIWELAGAHGKRAERCQFLSTPVNSRKQTECSEGRGRLASPRPLPPLRSLAVSEMAGIAEARGWPLFAGLELLTRRGLLWHGRLRDGRAGPDMNAWIIMDSSRRNAQARRIDGQPWFCGKAYSLARYLPDFANNWPVGAADIGDRPEVWLCEGQPDFCAALLVAWWGGLDVDRIAPVCVTGAGNTIHPDALPFFRGKQVYIPADADAPGLNAAGKWRAQLLEAGAASVRTFNLAAHSLPNGKPCKDLADFAQTLQSSDEVEDAPA